LTCTIEAPQQEIEMKDIQTTIYALTCRIHVDEWNDGEVWLSMRNDYGGTHTTLTREEAEKMIKGLQAILAKEVTA
jgi:hypothetical protein